MLSHAHIDHSGRLPLLIHRGYRGPIYVQETTARFCEIMLEDSARLAEGDAERENRKRERKDLPLVKPLYTSAEVEQTLGQFVTLPYLERREILPGVSIRYVDAGHILGSASVEVWLKHGGRRAQAGLQRRPRPVRHADPEGPGAEHRGRPGAHGKHLRRPAAPGPGSHRPRRWRRSSRRRTTAGATCSFRPSPSAAPRRLLYLFATHYAEWNLARWKIFLDSPMAIRTSQIYWDTPELQDAGGMPPPAEPRALRRRRRIPSAINRIRSGAIIIAGSGMCEGGRIVHHLKHNLWRPECDVIIVGYQANGTLGRQLVDGNTYVRIHQENIRVRARIHTVGGLSAHGDQDDLARWYGSFSPKPPVYLVHGESGCCRGARGTTDEGRRAAGDRRRTRHARGPQYAGVGAPSGATPRPAVVSRLKALLREKRKCRTTRSSARSTWAAAGTRRPAGCTDDLVLYDSPDLTTHAVIIGMTGSGKTGLGISLLEEAAIDRVPVIAIDPKGDLGNLLLTFPELRPADFEPWVDARAAEAAGQTVAGIRRRPGGGLAQGPRRLGPGPGAHRAAEGGGGLRDLHARAARRDCRCRCSARSPRRRTRCAPTRTSTGSTSRASSRAC